MWHSATLWKLLLLRSVSGVHRSVMVSRRLVPSQVTGKERLLP